MGFGVKCKTFRLDEEHTRTRSGGKRRLIRIDKKQILEVFLSHVKDSILRTTRSH